MIYEQMLTEKNRIQTKIQRLEKEIQTLPPGKMFCTTSGKYTKWFHNDGQKQMYIPKKNRAFAEQLAFKKLLMLQLKNLQQELTAINFYLKHHNPSAFQEETELFNSLEYHELLSPNYKPISLALHEWEQSPYEKHNKHPESLIHRSTSGHLVRSKSESMIASLLFKHKIPFHYEECLHLGDISIHPDFTIRHPSTGSFFYWEHFGLMNDYSYARNASNKLHLYISNGIIPTLQLITTFEIKEKPLSMATIEKIIKHYFL